MTNSLMIHVNLKNGILILIILLIGFQQFPIIRYGGSLKTYEVLALFFLVIYGIKMPNNMLSFGFFVLFVLSPIVSFINSLIFVEIPPNFFLHYPAAKGSFKYDNLLFPLLQIIYMLFNYAVFEGISSSKTICYKINGIFKETVIIGTFIALYSIVSCFTIDLIGSYFPDFIQNKSIYVFRSSGLSQEPSIYVLFQTWVVLITFYSKKLFRKHHWIVLLFVNVTSLVLTFSSSLVGLFILIILVPFIFKSSLKNRISISVSLLIGVSVTIFWILQSGLWDSFYYIFVEKVNGLILGANNTLTSGSFRNYTSRIGLEIFKDNPFFGVGVGNSVFFMHLYEYTMGIEVFGERLSLGTFPQSMISLILAEQGLFGILGFIIIVFSVIKIFWMNRNVGKYGRLFFIGGMFNIVVMLSIPVPYSLFMWVFIAMGITYFKHEEGCIRLKKYLRKIL